SSTTSSTGRNQAEALLYWKAGLDNQSQSRLSSWVGNNACNSWVGISCANNPELGQCKNMTGLKISGNNISGKLPSELGNAVQLRLIDLSWNHIEGAIPPELGNLNLLFNLSLNSNQLSGTIPPEFKMLSSLEYLILAENILNGSIAKELGECLSKPMAQKTKMVIAITAIGCLLFSFSMGGCAFLTYGETIAFTMKVDEKSDVYSFGVVTLEIIMGKHPEELISSLSSPPPSSLPSSSSSPPLSVNRPALLMELLDQRIPPPRNRATTFFH
ncbi:hypothetical protein Tsubulata_005838, partial [Turnera subulata]